MSTALKRLLTPGLTPWDGKGQGRLVADPQRGLGAQARWTGGGRAPSGAGSIGRPPESIPGATPAGPVWSLSPGERGPQEKGGGMIPPTYQQLGARPPAFDQSEPERRTWEAQGCSMSEARPALPVFKRSRSRRESPQGAVSARWREGRPTCRDSSIPKGATACVLQGKGFPLFFFFSNTFLSFLFSYNVSFGLARCIGIVVPEKASILSFSSTTH